MNVTYILVGLVVPIDIFEQGFDQALTILHAGIIECSLYSQEPELLRQRQLFVWVQVGGVCAHG
jgi:hypothetical protein